MDICRHAHGQVVIPTHKMLLLEYVILPSLDQNRSDSTHKPAFRIQGVEIRYARSKLANTWGRKESCHFHGCESRDGWTSVVWTYERVSSNKRVFWVVACHLSLAKAIISKEDTRGIDRYSYQTQMNSLLSKDLRSLSHLGHWCLTLSIIEPNSETHPGPCLDYLKSDVC